MRYLSILILACVASPSYGWSYAWYNPNTGTIDVDINNVKRWEIFSLTYGLTGDEPNFPLIDMPLVSVNDNYAIGETCLVDSCSGDGSLGNVAATGLPYQDLIIQWQQNSNGQTIWFGDYVALSEAPNLPEPSTAILGLVALCLFSATRRAPS